MCNSTATGVKHSLYQLERHLNEIRKRQNVTTIFFTNTVEVQPH